VDRNELNELAKQLVFRKDLSADIPYSYADEISALAIAAYGLVNAPQQFRIVIETLFNLGFVAGRDDRNLDLWRED